MVKVTLIEKVYGSYSPEIFQPNLLSLCKGLKVRLRVIGKTSRGWIKIEISGEDETVALNYLEKKVGFVPTFGDKQTRFSTVRGRVISPDVSEQGVHVDIGIQSPNNRDVVVPCRIMESQLTDGKKVSLQKLVERFCFIQNLPVEVKILSHKDTNREYFLGEFSEAQLILTTKWIRCNLDRLIVLGAPISEVEYALKRLRYSRDIIRVERLGLLESALLCKLGTDAVGLMPKIGPIFPYATIAAFCPRKIRKMIERPVL